MIGTLGGPRYSSARVAGCPPHAAQFDFNGARFMTPANTGLVLGQAFQTAYVTTDTDRALQIFKDRYGIGQFVRSGRRTLTLDGGRRMTMEISLGWVGNTQIEVIQPMADQVEVYSDWLPKQGFGLRFHHVGVRLFSHAQWDQMKRECAERGHRIIFELEASSTRALYIDTAADLGHYVEYLYYMDVANSTLPRIPQNIPGHETVY
jgi:hypothetical protein